MEDRGSSAPEFFTFKLTHYRQAAVITAVREARAEYDDHLGRVERGDGWGGLLSQVEQTVRKMPLWKLQTVGTERLEFLYENREEENPPEIVLKPGVAYCFRQFYSLVTEMVEGAWTQHVRRCRSFHPLASLPSGPGPQLRPGPQRLQR